MNGSPAPHSEYADVRSASSTRKLLEEVGVLISRMPANPENDFASQVALASLRSHEAQLQDELAAALMLEAAADVELVLDGDPVDGHSIQALFLGQFLGKFQMLINSVAQATTSVPTARAPIKSYVIAENRLMITGFVPGSFGLRCSLPSKQPGLLLGGETESSIDAVCSLLSGSAVAADALPIISQERVKKHYSELLQMLAKNGADVVIRTKSRRHGVRLERQQARDRIAWLELVSEEQKLITHLGVLTGGNIDSGRFDLKVGDETISGKVTRAALDQLKGIALGSEVVASMSATTSSHEDVTSESKTTYELISIALFTEDMPSPESGVRVT